MLARGVLRRPALLLVKYKRHWHRCPSWLNPASQKTNLDIKFNQYSTLVVPDPDTEPYLSQKITANMDDDYLAGRLKSEASKKTWQPWSEALMEMALHPHRFKHLIMQSTPIAIVINDKYPKARKHLLVVSRQQGLDSIEDLKPANVEDLKHIHSLGFTWAKSLLAEDPALVFRMGYHSDPSMRQLHLHVISQDFDSPSMKNEKHWNSFTTAFFRDSKDVIEELEQLGKVNVYGDHKSLNGLDLHCHKCQSTLPNILTLTQHIKSCQAPFPPELIQKGYLIMSK